MENQQEDRWQSSPILATATEKGKYLTIISLQTPPPDAKPDRTPEPENLWEVYGPRWWSALHSLGAEDTIVFNTETTGIETGLDEAVSIAVRSYASPSGAPVKYHSPIAPRFPGKLLERNAKAERAYDIHGIHPDDLAGQPPFPTVRKALWEIMWQKNRVCRNTDFDVALLDSLCLRHGLPLIPRKRVVCVMKLLSPLAGKWDECNEIAFAVHCRPGDEIFMDKTAHPLHYEGGALDRFNVHLNESSLVDHPSGRCDRIKMI